MSIPELEAQLLRLDHADLQKTAPDLRKINCPKVMGWISGLHPTEEFRLPPQDFSRTPLQ